MSRPTLSQQGCATLTGSSAVTTTMGTAAHACARSAMTTSATTCASQMAAWPVCRAGLGSTANSVSSQALCVCLEGGSPEQQTKPKKMVSSPHSLPVSQSRCGLPTSWASGTAGDLRTGLGSELSLLSAPPHCAKPRRIPLLHSIQPGFSFPVPPVPFKTPMAPRRRQEWEVSPGELGAPPRPGEGEWASGALAPYPHPALFSFLSCLPFWLS